MFIRKFLLTVSRCNGVQRATLSTILLKPLEKGTVYKNINSLGTVRATTQILYSKMPNNDSKNPEKLAQDPAKESLTNGQKLKKAVAEYGTTVIVFHIGISLISLGSCYLLVSSGLDVHELLVNVGLKEWVSGNTMLVSNAGTFAVAYAIHKVFAPVRIGITLTSVPFIVRYLRQKGILKK